MQLAETACRARESAGPTQTELARRMGTTQSAIAAIETGARTPTVKLLERLARARRATHDSDRRRPSGLVRKFVGVCDQTPVAPSLRWWHRACVHGWLFASGAATTAVSTLSQQRPDELPGETAKRRALRSDTSGRARAQACRPA
nr:helix-turn-helix transcriptional regulator [Mycobacterium malmoense]